MYLKSSSILLILLIIISISSVGYNYGYRRKFLVATSIQSLGGIIRDAYGDIVDIINILPEGAEPHSYQVTPEVIESLKDIEIFVFTGHFSFEYKIMESYPDKPVIYLDRESKLYSGYNITLLKYPDGEGYNPHGYWLYPDNAYIIAKAFRDVLVRIDPLNKDYYNSLLNNFEERIASLKKLYRDISERYGLNGSRVLIGFPAEEYIIYPLNVEIIDIIVRGPGQIIKPESVDKVVRTFRSQGGYIIISDIAIKMGVSALIDEISRLSGVKIIYIDVVGARYESYLTLMYINLGMISGGVSSFNPVYTKSSSEGELDLVLILFIILLIIVVVVEAIYIYLISRVY